MPAQYHTAVFQIYSDELRAEMAAWLTEQSAAGWETLTVSIIASRTTQTPQAFVVLRRELD